MAANAETLRDLGGSRSDRNITTPTAQDASVLAGDTYALADEGAVIINNRTRIAEIITALQRAGLMA